MAPRAKRDVSEAWSDIGSDVSGTANIACDVAQRRCDIASDVLIMACDLEHQGPTSLPMLSWLRNVGSDVAQHCYDIASDV